MGRADKAVIAADIGRFLTGTRYGPYDGRRFESGETTPPLISEAAGETIAARSDADAGP